MKVIVTSFRKKVVFVKVAIAAQLIFGLQAYGQHDNTQKENKIKPGKRQATLILSDGRKVELSASDSLDYTDQFKPMLPNDTTVNKTKPSWPAQKGKSECNR